MSLPFPPFQHALARPVSVSGIGLHTGERSTVTLRPGRVDSGIVFRRSDLEARLGGRARVEIPARLEHVSEVDHATTLTADTAAGLASVQTVEHLMAALAAAGIDACVVEVDGPEIPILDGSSREWVDLIEEAGRKMLAGQRRRLRVVAPKTVQSGGSSITVLPADELRLTCSIEFPHEAIGRQEISVAVTGPSFARELADSRTFGFLRDVEMLRRAGLARGGSLENAVVLDDDRVLNEEGLRHADEFVRHKALDLLGDLALTGCAITGHVIAHRAGHRLHVAFAKALLADASCWVSDALLPDAAASRRPAVARLSTVAAD